MAKVTTFISQPSDDDLKKFPDKVLDLIKLGREKGFVTHQEIMKALPDAEENVTLLDSLYTLFFDIGVNVIEAKEALNQTEMAGRTLNIDEARPPQKKETNFRNF